MITCKLCSEEREDKHFKFENGKVRKRTCYRCLGRRERAKLKLDMLEHFGGKCMCCGEDHPYFLTLDHVQNDGASYRVDYNEQQIYRLARKEGWPKDRFQLLCMNCNFAKGHYGECPHKMGLSSLGAKVILKQYVKTVMRTRHDLQASYRGNQWHKVGE